MKYKDHLTGQFIKPGEGEWVPITPLEISKRRVGWSPELKRSVYIEKDEEKDISELKRVREVYVVTVLNHLSGSTSMIELSDREKDQFDTAYRNFMAEGGQMFFTRKKVNRAIRADFEVRPIKEKNVEQAKKMLLSDKLI